MNADQFVSIGTSGNVDPAGFDERRIGVASVLVSDRGEKMAEGCGA